jgi:hypothetical protein
MASAPATDASWSGFPFEIAARVVAVSRAVVDSGPSDS